MYFFNFLYTLLCLKLVATVISSSEMRKQRLQSSFQSLYAQRYKVVKFLKNVNKTQYGKVSFTFTTTKKCVFFPLYSSRQNFSVLKLYSNNSEFEADPSWDHRYQILSSLTMHVVTFLAFSFLPDCLPHVFSEGSARDRC